MLVSSHPASDPWGDPVAGYDVVYQCELCHLKMTYVYLGGHEAHGPVVMDEVWEKHITAWLAQAEGEYYESE